MTLPSTESEERREAARYALRILFEPMVALKVRKGATPMEASEAAVKWLAGEMGIEPKDCRLYEMTAAETWLAVNIIREWRQGRTKVREAAHREDKRQRNEYYDRKRAAGGFQP